MSTNKSVVGFTGLGSKSEVAMSETKTRLSQNMFDSETTLRSSKVVLRPRLILSTTTLLESSWFQKCLLCTVQGNYSAPVSWGKDTGPLNIKLNRSFT